MNPAAATKPCAQCDAEVSLDALWGLCARCLYDEAGKLPARQAILSMGSRCFGDYELREVLGRGGMGVVYEALQISLRRPVALKMILDFEAASPSVRRRFTLEAETAAKLDHPNIVPIFEVGEHDGQQFLSMKFIPGENLGKKISSGELCLTPPGHGATKTAQRDRANAIVQLMATISRAVHHAHQHGVMHRDLKPANILVDREGQPHLTDFGLATLIDPETDGAISTSITMSGTVLGTPGYMSPEQAAGQRGSAASDTYSLGAILYEMLAGEPPFRAGTLLETLRLVAEQQPKRPSLRNPRIDRDLDTICIKCLEKNPAARYPTAEDLAEDLERWLRQEPIQARPAGLVLRLRRWVARNRMVATLIVSLCIGLAVALALLELTLVRQRKLDLHRANSVQRFSREVEEMWKDSGRQFVPIHSTDLAELADLPPRQADVLTTRLTFGLSINHEPLGQAMQYAPFLNALERRLEGILQRPVLIDLRLYKSQVNAVRDAARGELDIQRMGAFLYVLAKQAAPGLEPVVREHSRTEAVIFARKDSGITNLAAVAGRRVAFGQTNSTISFWAKVHLAQAGIRAGNLQSFVHLNGANPARGEDPSRPIGSEDRDSEVQSHKRVIEEVFLGRADVGEAPRRHFELSRYKRQGLVPLHVYRCSPEVYVARPGLDSDVVRALREAFVSYHGPQDEKLLAQLRRNALLEGFETAMDHDFDDIRRAMTRELAEFERGARNEIFERQPTHAVESPGPEGQGP